MSMLKKYGVLHKQFVYLPLFYVVFTYFTYFQNILWFSKIAVIIIDKHILTALLFSLQYLSHYCGHLINSEKKWKKNG